MNKAELIAAVESRLGSKKAASDALEAIFDAIIREVAKGGKVGITGFGTFEGAARAARTGRNPRTGQTVRIKKTTVPKFKAGTAFKTYVADPRKLADGTPAGAHAATVSVIRRASATPAKASAKAPTKAPTKAAAKKAAAKRASAK